MARKVKNTRVERIEYNIKKDFNTGVVKDFCIVNPDAIKVKNRSNRKLKSGRHFNNDVKGDVF